MPFYHDPAANPAAIDELVRLSTRDNAAVATGAIEALAKFHDDPRAFEVLADALKSSDHLLRETALNGLVYQPTPAMAALLVRHNYGGNSFFPLRNAFYEAVDGAFPDFGMWVTDDIRRKTGTPRVELVSHLDFVNALTHATTGKYAMPATYPNPQALRVVSKHWAVNDGKVVESIPMVIASALPTFQKPKTPLSERAVHNVFNAFQRADGLVYEPLAVVHTAIDAALHKPRAGLDNALTAHLYVKQLRAQHERLK